MNRAVFYVCRMISSQKERDFVNSNYDDIKRCMSIWLCMNMKENSLSFVHLTKEVMFGGFPWKGGLDLLRIVMIGLSNELPESETGHDLNRLLGALLSQNLSAEEKLDIMEQEYQIPLYEERKEVNDMCNLGEGIREQAWNKAWGEAWDASKSETIINMYKNHFTLDQIALATQLSEKQVQEILDNPMIASV